MEKKNGLFLAPFINWIRRGEFLKIAVELLLRLVAFVVLAGFVLSLVYFWIFNFPATFSGFIGLLYLQLILLAGACLLFQLFWFSARRIKFIEAPNLATVEITGRLFRLMGEISLLAGLVWGIGGGILGFISRFYPGILAAIPYTPFHVAQTPGIYLLLFVSGSFALFIFCYLIAELLLIKLHLLRHFSSQRRRAKDG